MGEYNITIESDEVTPSGTKHFSLKVWRDDQIIPDWHYRLDVASFFRAVATEKSTITFKNLLASSATEDKTFATSHHRRYWDATCFCLPPDKLIQHMAEIILALKQLPESHEENRQFQSLLPSFELAQKDFGARTEKAQEYLQQKLSPTNIELLNQLVDQWIASYAWNNAHKLQNAQEEPIEFIDHDWEQTYKDPELMWAFINCAYRRNLSESELSYLAAGELEQFLSWYGPTYIDRVEELAQKDKKFNDMLGLVWQLGMTEDVWLRVQEARQTAS